jgi:hypothetical protein
MKYKIKHVRDFLEVPSDRLDACLEEFKVFLALVRPFPTSLFEVNAFEWIDDGKNNVDIQITLTQEKQHDT